MKTLLLLCLAFTALAVAQQPIRLIPQPVSVVQQSGSYTLTNAAAIGYNTPAGRFAAEMLAQRLSASTGYALKAQQSAPGSIRLTIHASRVPQLGDEGYSLDASADGVVIGANTPAGLYYGAQTLLQLLPAEI